MKFKEAIVIERQRNARWNDEDRLELCRLLVKAGYTVAIERRQVGTGKEAVVVGYVQEDKG